MVPSVIYSPIWGMRTSVPGPEAAAGGLPCAAAGASTAAGVALSAAGAAGGSAFVGEAAGADEAEPPSSMVQTIVLIWTVVPSPILISFRVPAEGEGISAS